MYTELDCVGNVRHLHGDGNDDRTRHGDQGGYTYSAFGKLLRVSDPGALSGGVERNDAEYLVEQILAAGVGP